MCTIYIFHPSKTSETIQTNIFSTQPQPAPEFNDYAEFGEDEEDDKGKQRATEEEVPEIETRGLVGVPRPLDQSYRNNRYASVTQVGGRIIIRSVLSDGRPASSGD
jgi:hypothetical protein